ncbi:glutamate--cysteine ligase [Halobaculum sp. MBLA0143]|uniref:glutamate--cysteine ligase n=1 Tax=Halobaculum sp. MBLA0143 TaxID=3079933 RepID=UPI00352529A8
MPPNHTAMEGSEAFTRTGSLGVEEEFYIVDDAGRPTAGIDDLVYGDREPPARLADRLAHELFAFTIETQTPTIETPTPDRIATEVHETRDALVDHAAADGYRIAGAGLHPAARWRELDHAEKPRYRSQLDRIQFPQHRNTTAGVHVHVGVDDADKAVWVANQARWFLGPLLALCANSPFWNGFDTGLASARAKIFEALPNTGVPTRFDDFESFRRFERRMLEADRVRDRGELWFDVRPHTEHGTVEVRVPDGQSDPDVVTTVAEYVRALVVDLAERYEDETQPTAPPTVDVDRDGRGLRRELLDENKWRAMRYGHDADFLDRDGDSLVTLPDHVERETDRLGTDALVELLERESGAARQRRLAGDGEFDALCRDLVL